MTKAYLFLAALLGLNIYLWGWHPPVSDKDRCENVGGLFFEALYDVECVFPPAV